MATKRPVIPASPTYDPMMEELASQVAQLQKRVAALETRAAINPNQRNCKRCGRLIPTRSGKCTLCGGEASVA